MPSELPEEPGLPDEFHDFQPQLLSRTLHLKDYATDQKFTSTDLNVYYDVYHTIWLSDLNIGLGLWDNCYEGMPGPLLR